MTTADIETRADIGQLSDPSIDAPKLLRDEVIPEFLHDVGYVSWRRRTATISLSAATKKYALPSDFEIIQSCYLSSTNKELQYIGEHPDKMAAAAVNATNAAPTGFYLDYDGSAPNSQNQLSLQAPADASYTLVVVYYCKAVFTDYTTSVDLAKWIPPEYQAGVVQGLRMKICFFRLGIGDPRYLAEERAYAQWVDRVQENKERARRNLSVFVK